MNKLIQELAEQAFTPINDMASEGIADRSTFNAHWFRLYNQKFAELIVQECMCVVSRKCASSTAYNALVDHFEIRE